MKQGYKFINMKKFVDDHYSWEVIKRKFERLVDE